MQIVVFGTGGFGREVHELIEDINDHEATFDVVGFLDGDASRHGTDIHGLPVLGDVDWIRQYPGTAVVLGVGNPRVKMSVAEQLARAGAVFPTIIHPRAVVGRRVVLGEGVIVTAGAILTTDILVEPFVTFNLDCTVGHDSHIQRYVATAPGVHISGNVQIGAGTDVGTGASVIQGVSIGEWSVIGAGAVVTRDIPANVTAVGVPAAAIKQREAGWHLA